MYQSNGNHQNSSDFLKENCKDEIIKQIENFDLDLMLDDLKDRIDSDEIFGNVSIEENDPLFELKTFYNTFLTAFDFEDIKNYYLSCGSESIEVTLENYIDFKIAKEERNDIKYDLYFNYLSAFFYINIDKGQFSDALSYIIQLAILISNENDVSTGNIIERKPGSISVLFEIDRFLNHKPLYDLDDAFKAAVSNFKVDEWSNNHKEVYDAISQLLS